MSQGINGLFRRIAILRSLFIKFNIENFHLYCKVNRKYIFVFWLLCENCIQPHIRIYKFPRSFIVLMNHNEKTNVSFASLISIFALSLASITIAINSQVIHITLAQKETEDFVDMEMDNGTTISVANGSGMMLDNDTHVIENSTVTVMENGTVQNKNASDPDKGN